MSKHIISERRASNLTGGIFLICLAFLAITNTWWPGILIAIGLTAALRQFFRGKYYDMAISIIIFCGLFTLFILKIKIAVILPVLLAVAGIYIILREFMQPDDPTEEEIEDNIELEIEEDLADKNK